MNCSSDILHLKLNTLSYVIYKLVRFYRLLVHIVGQCEAIIGSVINCNVRNEMLSFTYTSFEEVFQFINHVEYGSDCIEKQSKCHLNIEIR